MVNIIKVAGELDYLKIPEGVLIETDAMKRYTPEQIVLITTGSQGESMAALSRMAANLHRKVQIQAGDCVVFSSSPIPGNEKSVARVINELGRKGAKVIFQDTHVSGHACQEEIKLMYSLVKPKFCYPVHGEFRHLMAQRDICYSLGYDQDHVIMTKSGDVVSIDEEKFDIIGHVQTGAILVDGLGVGDVGNIVLRDRQNLAENGIIIIVLTLEKYTCNLIAGPDIVTRGFVYVREAEDLLADARGVVTDTVEDCVNKRVTDWSKIKTMIKDDLSEYLWKKMKRTPVILPIIMEAH
jgi:ribonuclease J